MSEVGFTRETMVLPVSDLYPLFPRKIELKKSGTYKRIVSSIKELGMIEPIVVVERESRYFIKDGYLRWQALKELEIEIAECLMGTDLDSYTYNKRINALAPVQAHSMIDRAVKEGVDPDRIAAALNVSRDWVDSMETLIDGLSPEVVRKLKKRIVGKNFFIELKKVTHDRQLEILQLVEAADDYSVKYVKALVFATSIDQKVSKKGRPRINPREQEELAGQLKKVETEFRRASVIFRDNVFNLVKLSGYIRKLLSNQNLQKFLDRQYPDILFEFEKIANDPSLNV